MYVYIYKYANSLLCYLYVLMTSHTYIYIYACITGKPCGRRKDLSAVGWSHDHPPEPGISMVLKKVNQYWSVVTGLEHQFYFPRNIRNGQSSQLTKSYFSGFTGFKPPTRRCNSSRHGFQYLPLCGLKNHQEAIPSNLPFGSPMSEAERSLCRILSASVTPSSPSAWTEASRQDHRPSRGSFNWWHVTGVSSAIHK